MGKEISETALAITEADIKKAVEDRLQIAQNQGQLIYLRLNSGNFIEIRGETRRRIKGTPKGTSDYVVFQGVERTTYYQGIPYKPIIPQPACRVTFLEIKSSTGEQSPEQKAFEEKVTKLHCRYYIIRDADQIEEILR